MLFNSLDFAVFLPLVFALYWLSGSKKTQNLILFLASLIFYGWWNLRFLSLILFSILLDFFLAKKIEKSTDTQKKWLLYLSLSANLGLLGVFKYFNFFIDSFVEVFAFFSVQFSPTHLNIILPVGISFYTFQTLSYSIDVYRGKIKASNDFIAFGSFVSFFPQLVAGPIERATNLLPQFQQKRVFNYTQSVDGLRQILWGFIKKVVIADHCAVYVNMIYADYTEYSGFWLLMASVLFAFQIYGDFSGYSDIAIGTAKLFGVSLMQNFAFPYFSRDIAEFWRRWHISLSTWFRDYLYIPLGGSKTSLVKQIRNTFAVFLVSGFWHGANFTFIVWGGLNALYFLPLLLGKKNRRHLDVVAQHSSFASLKELYQMATTFLITTLAWVFFRASSVEQACLILKKICSFSLFNMTSSISLKPFAVLILLLFTFLVVEWMGRADRYALERLFTTYSRAVRFSFYALLIVVIGLFMQTTQTSFIYFQF